MTLSSSIDFIFSLLPRSPFAYLVLSPCTSYSFFSLFLWSGHQSELRMWCTDWRHYAVSLLYCRLHSGMWYCINNCKEERMKGCKSTFYLFFLLLSQYIFRTYYWYIQKNNSYWSFLENTFFFYIINWPFFTLIFFFFTCVWFLFTFNKVYHTRRYNYILIENEELSVHAPSGLMPYVSTMDYLFQEDPATHTLSKELDCVWLGKCFVPFNQLSLKVGERGTCLLY